MRYVLVRQHDQADCGPASLAMVCLHYGKQVTSTMLHDLCGTTADGTTVSGLCDGASKLGLKAVPVYVGYDDLMDGDVTYPFICATVTPEGYGHYVVVTRIGRKGVRILDPALGRRRESAESFRKEFTGRIVLFAPDTDFTVSSGGRDGLLHRFMGMLKPHSGLFATIIVIGFVLTLIGIGLSVFYRVLIDDIIGNSLEEQVTAFFLFYLMINLFNVALSTVRQRTVIHLSQKLSISLMLGYFGHILRLPMRFFGTRKRGDIITRYQDAGTVVDVLTGIIVTVLMDIVFAAVSAFFLYSISPELFRITLVMVALSAVLIYAFLPSYRRLNRESMVAESGLNSNIIESLSNVETIKTNSAEDRQLESMEGRLVDSLSVGLRAGILGNIQGTMSSVLSAVGGVAMMWVGTLSILGGGMTLGTLMSFYSLSEFFTGPIGRFVSLQIEVQEADIALKRLSEIFDVEEESCRGDRLMPASLRGDIVLEGVTFGYGSGKPVLKDFDLTIRGGERVAIIGESGSGKSTLGKLISGLWRPDEGTVTISGQCVDDMDLQSMRQRIAYVQQDTELFSGTVAENLRLSKEDASYEEMLDSCEKAQCMQFISGMPRRFDTVLEEGGANLSGGERQRLSIARALLKDSDILIMDEATGSLDMMVESRVLDGILGCRDGRTVIMIAHRLSAVTRCDRIVVMDRGRIAEDGTHEELLEAGGIYADLWNSQFRKGPAEDGAQVPDIVAEDDGGIGGEMEYRGRTGRLPVWKTSRFIRTAEECVHTSIQADR